MMKSFKAPEYPSVWKAFRRSQPRTCPHCTAKQPMRLVNSNPHYMVGLQSKTFACTECDAQVDCIWPKRIVQAVTVAYARA